MQMAFHMQHACRTSSLARVASLQVRVRDHPVWNPFPPSGLSGNRGERMPDPPPKQEVQNKCDSPGAGREETGNKCDVPMSYVSDVGTLMTPGEWYTGFWA